MKPANILIDENMDVLICDFGIAKILKSDSIVQSNFANSICGTYPYLSPEMLTKYLSGDDSTHID